MWRHAARVAQAIEAAKQHGALTIAITGAAGGAVTQAADRALVIELDRPFSPLLYHVFAGYVASYLAVRLNRLPFQAGQLFRTPPTP